MDQDGTWHGGRPWSSPHCARWGHSSPLPKRGQIPQFSPHFYCGQTAGCIKMPLGMEVGLSPSDCVRWGSSPLPQKGRSPTQFSAHVYCGQTAACIKMPLGTEVDLGLRDIVFDVDPATPEKRAHPPPPNFLAHVCCGQMAGWMKTPLNWYGSRPCPRPQCTRRGPSSRERGSAAPYFRPMCIVATVAHLTYC